MKKLYLLTVFLLSVFISFAQFSETWNTRIQATTTANYSNEGSKVATDAASNVFVLGDFSSDKDTTGHGIPSTEYTVRLFKHDYLGTLLATRYIIVGGLITNGSENNNSFALQIDASGNVYIGYEVMNGSGNYDVVIAKYNNNLSLIWSKTYATAANDVGIDLKVVGNTVYAIVKSYSANVTYSIVTATPASISATALVSFIANVDVVNAFLPTGKLIYVTGYSLIQGVKTVLTAAVSSTGSVKWKVNYDHNSITGDDYGSSMVLGTDGFIYVMGTTQTGGAAGSDAVILKYNTSGALQRNLFMDRSASDIGCFIANGPSGYLFGSSSSPAGAYVYKIQTNANLLAVSTWTGCAPAPAAPYTSITGVTLADMKIAASNNIYICGTVNANAVAGNFSASFLYKVGFNGIVFRSLNSQVVQGDFMNNYSSQMMVLDGVKNDILWLRNFWNNNTNHAEEKLYLGDLDGGASLRLSSSNNLQPTPQISLYPNPANNNINIESLEYLSSVTISDMTGRVVKTVNVTQTGMISIPISDLRNGLYICQIMSESGMLTVKNFMKE